MKFIKSVIGITILFNSKNSLEKYNTGARALKVIVDEMFQEILYGIFDAPGEIDTLIVTNDTVNNNKTYKLRKKSK